MKMFSRSLQDFVYTFTKLHDKRIPNKDRYIHRIDCSTWTTKVVAKMYEIGWTIDVKTLEKNSHLKRLNTEKIK